MKKSKSINKKSKIELNDTSVVKDTGSLTINESKHKPDKETTVKTITKRSAD